MGFTISEKILARASGREEVRPGEVVVAKVDFAMVTDSSGPRRFRDDLRSLGVGVWDPDRLAVIADHFVPAGDAAEAEIGRITREWVREYGVSRFHSLEGICHILVPERGYVHPGMLYVGGDSHSPTAGALGAFAIGVGATEMLGVIVTGEIWLRVPSTIRVVWHGQLPPYAMAKDIVLRTLKDLTVSGATYKAVEWDGEAVHALRMDERLVLPNMAAEMGAKTGIIAPDEITYRYLEQRGVPRDSYTPVFSDPDATYERELTYDATSLEPLVALPSSPDKVVTAREAQGERIDQAYIGACTGAKYHDLAMAAAMLSGRRVAPAVRLLVAPSSRRIYLQALQDGIVETLAEAGAIFLPSACGACAGLGLGVVGSGERCISSTNRNFPGRMGARDAEVFLASPLTVAAAAIAGEIVDPRDLLPDGFIVPEEVTV